MKRQIQIHGCDKVKDIIEDKVLNRNWTFNQISNLRETIASLCEEIYIELKLTERFELIRDIKINENFVGYTFEDVMRDAIKIKLSSDIAETITAMLSNATINFGGHKNEISENGMGGESSKKRTANDKKKDENKE